MSATDLAWIAGFFDGEGHCGLSLLHSVKAMNQGYSPNVTIANTSREILMTIYRIVGLGQLRDTVKATAVAKRSYRLDFPIPHQLKFLKLILPFLKLKKRQAELVIEYHETCKVIKTSIGSQLTQEQVKHREEIYLMLKALNVKGPT